MSPIAADRHPSARPSPNPVPDPAPEPSEDGRRVSEETYWQEYYLASEIRYEWNNGRLEEIPVSDYGTFLVYAWLFQLLQHFLAVRPLARMVALEMGFRFSWSGGTVVRRPDLGVVRNDNPVPLLAENNRYRGIFDLCIEALSDSERRGIERDTVVKKAEYAAAGVPEYYILHRDPGRQAFFTRTEAGVYVPIAPQDGIVRSRVLPGLQLRLADLCARPDLKSMRDDPVYADFILPEWRESELRAAAEQESRRLAEARAGRERQARLEAERRADAEGRRADAEGRRADAEAQARREAEQELARLRASLERGGPERR